MKIKTSEALAKQLIKELTREIKLHQREEKLHARSHHYAEALDDQLSAEIYRVVIDIIKETLMESEK